MSWFNRVRNSLPFVAKRSTEETLWIKCKGCGEMIFASDYADNLHVCPRCGHHGRIGADLRIEMLMDDSTIGYDAARTKTGRLFPGHEVMMVMPLDYDDELKVDWR